LSDRGATNLWDEICVQARQESPWFELYRAEMAKRLAPLISGLSDDDRLVLWFCRYDDAEGDPEEWASALAQAEDGRLIDIVLDRYVAPQTWNYENARIREMMGE
jgi:hypothetical protein